MAAEPALELGAPEPAAPATGARRAGRALMALGVLLVATACVLFAWNQAQDRQAGAAAEGVLAELDGRAGERPDAQDARDASRAGSGLGAGTMTVVTLDGYDYVGRLVLPTLGLNLPVMASWDGDYDALAVAPCRQFGTPQTHDLVIAGHNYQSHFGTLSHLTEGDEVLFEDMDGAVWRYRVALVETLDPRAVDAVRESPYDLTLYTCTYGGQSRVVVRCMLA